MTFLIGSHEARSAFNNPNKPADFIESFEDMEARLEEADKLFEKARRFAKRKEYEKAIEYFEESIKKNSDSINANNGLAWLLLTCDDLKYRDLKRALVHAKKAISDRLLLFPHRHNIYMIFSTLHFNIGSCDLNLYIGIKLLLLLDK